MQIGSFLIGLAALGLAGCGNVPRQTPLSAIQGEPAAVNTQVVNSIQTSLVRLGYDVDVVDGLIDGSTQAAIRAYQREHELEVDGRATPELADHLWSRGHSRVFAPRPPTS